MLRVNCFRSLAVACVLATANFASAAAIVNVDLEGYRTGGGSTDANVPPTTYVGTGAAGGGTVFNGVSPTALSDTTGSPTTGDNQTYSANGLLNSFGGSTGVNLSIGPVGVDNENTNIGVPTDPMALFNDYVFNNSAGNSGNAGFTLSGLTPGGTYEVYLYAASFLDHTSITGGIATPFSPTGIFTSANTVLYTVDANALGDINGVMGAGTQLIAGLTVEAVPEPGSLAALVGLCGMGLVGLVIRRRRAAR